MQVLVALPLRHIGSQRERREILSPMGSSLVNKLLLIKIDSEFVDKATQIIDLIYAHLDKNQTVNIVVNLLNKSRIAVVSEPPTQQTQT